MTGIFDLSQWKKIKASLRKYEPELRFNINKIKTIMLMCGFLILYFLFDFVFFCFFVFSCLARIYLEDYWSPLLIVYQTISPALVSELVKHQAGCSL